MKIITNEKVNFNSLEEEIYIKMMELGRTILQDKLREVDKLIKEYRDKDLFEIKDMQLTTIKSKLGEITKKSYRETAKTISEDTENVISHIAVRNIVLKLGAKFKKLEEEKIKLYEEGKLEGSKEVSYVFCEYDGIYIKKNRNIKKVRKKRK